MPHPVDTQPLPEGGWSEEIRVLKDAIVVPPVENGFVQAAGVLDSRGDYCPHGALWRRHRPLTTEPAMPTGDVRDLAGRWLWGGVLWAHFGHFLVESSSRLWALDHLDQPVDGILFIPKRPRAGERTRGFQLDFFRMMAPDLPVRVVAEPTRSQELIVPGQGFGLGKITAGTSRFRSAIHKLFARDIQPDGPDRIYLSRSALGLGKGGMLGEERMEDLLQTEGYEIFHPQQHDLATQIARYKAARQVIAADGSAVHLYAMVGRPDQSVAMILRRQSLSNNLLADNVRHFCGTEPRVISALRTEWVRKSQKKSSRLSFGELDHASIGAELAQAGFISSNAQWPALSEAERQQIFAEKNLNKRAEFIESPQFVKRRVRAIRQARRSGKPDQN